MGKGIRLAVPLAAALLLAACIGPPTRTGNVGVDRLLTEFYGPAVSMVLVPDRGELVAELRVVETTSQLTADAVRLLKPVAEAAPYLNEFEVSLAAPSGDGSRSYASVSWSRRSRRLLTSSLRSRSGPADLAVPRDDRRFYNIRPGEFEGVARGLEHAPVP